jgi:hypothetical protein
MMRLGLLILFNFAGLESEVKTVKEQLTLLNIQLQFERHRREAHAERNRRLLGKSKSNRALEEHNSALVSFLLVPNMISFKLSLIVEEWKDNICMYFKEIGYAEVSVKGKKLLDLLKKQSVFRRISSIGAQRHYHCA